MNLFPKQRVPYYVWAPSYTHISAGVRALHLLVHALNEAGERAYLWPDNPVGYAADPELNTPVITQHPEWQNFYANNFIAVYPDIVSGNPLSAANVVRYLLAPRGAYGGDKKFGPDDNVWGFLPNLADKVLPIPLSDPSIFYGGNERRSGSCFYAHKYDKIHGNELLDITKNSVRLEGTPNRIAGILRKSGVCYVYELSTIITDAALCYCPVVLIHTPYFNKIDPEAMMGNVQWSDGGMVKKCDDYYVEYHKIINNFPSHVQKFIEDTQKAVRL